MENSSGFGPAPAGKLKLLREPLSGHCHRVELFLSILELECEFVDVDVQAGEARSDYFRRLNPLMEVPVLWHGALPIIDSTAILVYLGLTFDDGTWSPRDPLGCSRVQRWLSIASGELLNGPVSARRIKLFNLPLDPERAQQESDRLLAFMDAHLCDRPYLVFERPTTADIALYTYVAHSPEGGLALRRHGNIMRWIDRIERWDRFVPMRKSPEATPLTARSGQ